MEKRQPKEAFEPTIDFNCLPEPVMLEEGDVKLEVGGDEVTALGKVCLELAPSLGIFFHCNYETNHLFSDVTSFKFNGKSIKGFPIKSSANFKGERKVKWCPHHEPITALGNDETQLRDITAHIFDFPKYTGSRHSVVQKENESCVVYHLDLIYKEWCIEVKDLAGEDSHEHQLSHVVCIKKNDEADFTAEEGRRIIDALNTFFTFAKGNRCNILCPSGFNQNGEKVWQEWSSPSRLEQVNSWFDVRNAEQLNMLFPLFMKLWSDEDWREALKEVVYWYSNACISSRGIDAGIILTQAAIERLSYEYVVKDKELLSAKGFRDLRASDKYRLLFSSLGVPIEISKDTPEIELLASKYNWADIPHALTEIRNALIHPESKNRKDFKAVYFEAWKVGLWCLELGLLAVCKYTGTYGNRLTVRHVGQVENVPWIEKEGMV